MCGGAAAGAFAVRMGATRGTQSAQAQLSLRGVCARGAAAVAVSAGPSRRRVCDVRRGGRCYSGATGDSNAGERDRYVVTTPLYYANAAPHMGSAYPTIAADALARFKRMQGYDVSFVTGTDEHGEKIAAAAEKNGMQPQTHCDEVVELYKSLWRKLGIEYDSFVRTSDARHAVFVNRILDAVWAKGDIYEAEYEGLYCVGCEEYKDEKELEEEEVCPIHKTRCDARKERNYFFRLSRYQREIEELLESNPDFVMPESRRNEVLGWVKDGLRDFSISRAAVSWGIPIDRDPEQTVYVWFDALLGYISALMQMRDVDASQTIATACARAGWPANVHIIGKDILRFHAVYWPAMLMSAGLPLPSCVFGHGFLTKDGLKMGKSLGNVLHPNELVDAFGADSVRYYFLREMEFGRDGDFSETRFVDKVNAALANDVGNLLNRTLKMMGKNCGGLVRFDTANEFPVDHPLRSVVVEATDAAERAYSSLRFHDACEAALSISGQCNLFLEQKKPWTKLKSDSDAEKAEAERDLVAVLEATRIVALILWPVVPSMSVRILEQLRIAGASRTPNWDDVRWGGLKSGHELSANPRPVFMRIEATMAEAI